MSDWQGPRITEVQSPSVRIVAESLSQSLNMRMHATELEKTHIERYQSYVHQPGEPVDLGRILCNPRLVASIGREKTFLPCFDLQLVKGLLPFSPPLFVSVCPRCLSTSEDVQAFDLLTAEEMIIPILEAPYPDFAPRVVEAVFGRDHISYWQFESLRFAKLNGLQTVCQDCVDKAQRRIVARIPRRRARKSRRWTRLDAEIMFENLWPYVAPDEELLRYVAASIRKNMPFDWLRIVELSFQIRNMRSAQALSGSVVLDSCAGSSEWFDKHDKNALGDAPVAFHELVADRLGLRVPREVPLEAYIEIVKAFGPRIRALVASILETASTQGTADMSALHRTLTDINHEIARVTQLRRYMVVEMLAGLVRRHPRALVAALAATVTSAAPGWVKASAIPIAAVMDRLRRTPKVSNEKSALRYRLTADIAPYLEKVATSYLRTNETTMQVISARSYLNRVGRGAATTDSSSPSSVKRLWHCH